MIFKDAVNGVLVVIALVSLNLLAFVYDSQWIQVAMVVNGALIVSYTGIKIKSKGGENLV